MHNAYIVYYHRFYTYNIFKTYICIYKFFYDFHNKKSIVSVSNINQLRTYYRFTLLYE